MTRHSESGYALATLLLFAALLLIAISVALPDLKTRSKREKEIELQFRAMQYVRAISAYNRKFPNQWPTSIDALMNTNNVRFLRKKWADPLTKDGEWRLIHLAPNGTVIDSLVAPVTPNVPSATGTSVPAGGQIPSSSPPSSPGAPLGLGTASAVSSLSTTQVSNLPIVGVASRSTDQSLMSCNGYTHYNEWEYIALPQGRFAGTGCYQGIPIAMLSPVGVVPAQPAPGPGRPGQPGIGSAGPSSVTPPPTTGGPPTNPFGASPPRKK